ncbi:MAG: hypothetical protein PVI19_14295, partial [Syntrophobacterales bacterium]
SKVRPSCMFLQRLATSAARAATASRPKDFLPHGWQTERKRRKWLSFQAFVHSLGDNRFQKNGKPRLYFSQGVRHQYTFYSTRRKLSRVSGRFVCSL